MTEDEIVDIAVIGSGVAGLCAGIAARRAGLEVMLVDKQEQVGGGSSYSWGLLWAAPNHLAQAEGLADDPVDVARYLDYLGGGEADPDRMRTFIEQSPVALRFFAACGVPFRLAHGITDHYHLMAPGSRAEGRSLEVDLFHGEELGDWRDRVVTPDAYYRLTAEELVSWGGMNNAANWPSEILHTRETDDVRGLGVGLVSQLLKVLLDAGTEPRLDTRIVALIRQGRRVVGIETANGQRIRARRGVIITTGGYESDDEHVRIHEGLPRWRSMFPAALTGDGLKLGTEAGAAVRAIHNNMSLFLGYEVPASAGRKVQFRLAGIIELCSPHTLVVNGEGQRFGDESFFPGMIPELTRFDARRHRYANLPCYLIFDQQYVDTYAFLGKPVGTPMPPWVTRANTSDELAEALGIDGDNLSATAVRFNRFAIAGRDEDFQRGDAAWTLAKEGQREGKRSLGTVAVAPFYGIELHPSALSSAGLATDHQARVMDASGKPIPGLYASGNAAARTEYGAGYQAGHSHMSAMTFSYLAVQRLAGDRPAPGS